MARDPGAAQRALKHGGGAGELAVSRGTEFTGLAAEQEKRVIDELQTDGIPAIVERNAIRLQTVADLYYQAILGAGNMNRLDQLVKRYGWIAASALRAWKQVQEVEAADHKTDAIDVLNAIRGDNGNPTD